jgi:methionyl-tRNA formyltransferase
MKIILCGYHWSGCKALDLLLRGGHEVFVYTHENPPEVPSLTELCRKRFVPFSTKNISAEPLPFHPDIICSVFYRFIIKVKVIECCGGKIFNLHPSLLPKYRGCSSITWALINGESETGFTYHYIDEGCDTGPMIIQKAVPIEDWDTQASLYNRVMFESMGYFQSVLEMVKSGSRGKPQEGESSYYPRGCPHKGIIDSSWEIDYVARFIRAMNYPPLPFANFNGREIRTIEDYLQELKRYDCHAHENEY